MNIILCGFKSSGKTTAGQLLAKQLGYQFLDIDTVISGQHYQLTDTDLTVRDIYNRYGDKYFRELEKSAVKSLTNITDTVIATAGGTVVNPDNVLFLKTIGKLLYLQIDEHTLWQRISKKKHLPAFIASNNPQQSFSDYYQSRKEIYEQVADKVIDTNDKNQWQIVKIILDILTSKK